MESEIKKKRYWLRGSVLGFLFSFLTLATIPIIYKISPVYKQVLLMPVKYAYSYLNFLPFMSYGGFREQILFFIIFQFLFYTGCGFVIGWLYGKIKNRKSSNLTSNS
ncbi:MAG: hypothetical protein RJA61_604 [Candidatus Parcubacteria bacterium]|jgi:hypothetical protein